MKRIIMGMFVSCILLVLIITFMLFSRPYQRINICEPMVKETVTLFLSKVPSSTYELMRGESIFHDKERYEEFKALIKSTYKIEIGKWDADWAAYSVLEFENHKTFTLFVVPENNNICRLLTCVNAKYIVASVQ